MLDTLITSKTRLKLLVKFFLNKNITSYLRGLESEFKEGSNAIRVELNRFEEAGLLESKSEGNKKFFRANVKHPLFGDLQSLVRKYVGIDQIIEKMVKQIGNIDQVYLSGKLAEGLESEIVELLFIGSNLDKAYISKMSEKVELLIDKKISYVFFEPSKFTTYKNNADRKLLLIWNKV